MQTQNIRFNPFARAFDKIRQFFAMQAAGGIVLVIASALALIIANSPLYTDYNFLLNQTKLIIGFAASDGSFDYTLSKPLHLWINDALMAVFFLLVGLEIKREFVTGELSTRSRAILPIIAAIGGMAIPAALYYMVNHHTPENLPGWAIPSATDIAFSLGVLALLGSKAPIRLKILLTAIAVIDDLGAIVIIALFYAGDMHLEALIIALIAMAGMFLLNKRGVSAIAPYILIGVVLWVAVLKSGIHATLAGVITAMFIPMNCRKDPDHSPCEHLIHGLHPYVAFGILPIFGFANAGVPFTGMGFHSLFDPVTLGIILGLVVGKQLGIFATIWLCVKSGLCPMVKGVGWIHIYGISILCGIGFTMSLFIGGLAFADLQHQASIRLGVLVGSLISAVLGFAILYFAPPAQEIEPGEHPHGK